MTTSINEQVITRSLKCARWSGSPQRAGRRHLGRRSRTASGYVKKAGDAVKDGVTPDTTSAVCKDGTTQTGKTKTTACNGHGGIAAK